MATSQIGRGFWGIEIFYPKTECNIGTLFRSAFNFGADFIFTIGPRYRKQSSDTPKAWKHIPLTTYKDFDDFNEHRPYDSILVGVEQTENSFKLDKFRHPERAVYLLGAEDSGLPQSVMDMCQYVVEVPYSRNCLNVAVAGSILGYYRVVKSNA